MNDNIKKNFRKNLRGKKTKQEILLVLNISDGGNPKIQEEHGSCFCLDDIYLSSLINLILSIHEIICIRDRR